jgi:hypothetical protein
MSSGFTASLISSAQDLIFRVSVGGRREAAVAPVNVLSTFAAGEIFEVLLYGRLGSIFTLMPSGSEEKLAQMVEGRFSAVPDGFIRLGGI